MIKLADSHPNPRNIFWDLALTFAFTVSFIFILYQFLEPRWETNDDVGMSMVAHGYGIASTGSPTLVFSNVLWGYFVRLIPEFHGILGYSIATLGILVLVGTATLSGMIRLGIGHVGAISTFVLILLRPALFPQFTINAGLLMVVAIFCVHHYASQKKWPLLLAASAFALLSFLVRSEEFLLILIVASPLIAWTDLIRDKTFVIAMGFLIVALMLASLANHYAYTGSDWKAFNDLKPSISAIVDFGAGEQLKHKPDILDRYGYSANDIDLIRHWFFVDPSIANPQKLDAMLRELGPLPAQGNSWSNAVEGVKTLLNPLLIVTVLIALLLAALQPGWRVAACWCLGIAAVFILGLIGRPGVVRVYVPLVSLLLVASLLKASAASWRKKLTGVILLVGAAVNSFCVLSDAHAAKISTLKTREALSNFQQYPVFSWGSKFPFEDLYPVLEISHATRSHHIYSLGAYTLAPFSFAYTEQQNGRGFIVRFTAKNGIAVIANEQWSIYLDTYCGEHLHGQANELYARNYGETTVSQRSCEVGK